MAELHFTYANINHGRAANTHLLQTVGTDIPTDVVIITEPYVIKASNRIPAENWDQYRNGQAAILLRKSARGLQLLCNIPHVVCVKLQDLTIISAYASPNQPIDNWLEDLADYIATVRGPLLVAGDFNCTTSIFPGQATTRRGELFEDFLLATQLNPWIPNAPTWGRTNVYGTMEGYNDCFLTQEVHIKRGQVLLDRPSLSDHRYVTFTIEGHAMPPDKRYRLDKEMLEEQLKEMNFHVPEVLTTEQEIDEYVSSLTLALQQASEECTFEIVGRRKPIKWWTPELDELKRYVTRCHRMYRRECNPLRQILLRELHKAFEKRYKNTMRKAKVEAWKRFISPRDAWGKPYRLLKALSQSKRMPALQRPDGSLSASADENVTLLLDAKFVDASLPEVNLLPQGYEGPAPRITPRAIADIIKTLNNRKSPGPDQVTHSMLKVFHRHHPQVLSLLFTSCLTLGYFPRKWRTGRVVFIPKPGKPPMLTDSYRPITLLSCLGKVLERLVNTVLLSTLEDQSLLHNAQFGFRPGHSTEEAVTRAICSINRCRRESQFAVAISCDIKGAFDNARWDRILTAPALEHIPTYIWRLLQSYLTDRYITCEDQHRNLDRGCPQGSVLGPVMWNLVHDYVIRQMAPRIFDIVCYADDTLLIIGGNSAAECELKASLALTDFETELRHNGLALNKTKSEFLQFIPRGARQLRIQTSASEDDVEALAPSSSMRYLGVLLDPKFNFTAHFDSVIAKCRQSLPVLTQLCQRTCGYSTAARRIMVYGAIYTRIFYCSSVFYHRLSLKTVREKLKMKIQRPCDLIRIRAYRTASADGSMVIANSPPLDLLVLRRSILYELKQNRVPRHWGPFTPVDNVNDPQPAQWETAILDEWNYRWQQSQVSEWTHQLFPTIPDRQKTPVRADFWLTQALTGHGCFGSYLKKFRRRQSEACRCGFPLESPEHVFRSCPLYENKRPLHWIPPLGESHMQYLTNTVLELWQSENPGHLLTKRTDLTHDTLAQPRPPNRRRGRPRIE